MVVTATGVGVETRGDKDLREREESQKNGGPMTTVKIGVEGWLLFLEA
jgi:hypothetical protein